MNITTLLLKFQKYRPVYNIYKLLNTVIKKGKLKPIKVILPDDKSFTGYVSPNKHSIINDIQDVKPIKYKGTMIHLKYKGDKK